MNSLNPFISEPETTGRYLVLMRDDAVDSGIQTLRDSAGISSVTRAADCENSALTAEQLQASDTVVFDHLGVAVVTIDPDQLQSLSMARASDASSPIAVIEPERVVYALGDAELASLGQLKLSSTANLSVDYLQGYRNAVNNLIDHLISTNDVRGMSPLLDRQSIDETTETWGLQLTNVVKSKYSGRGIKVAVLDTGLDLTHPDFTGRKIVSKSFIENQEVQDRQGHGTHCIGTACGAKNAPRPPRYGVAYDAEIFVGKVLSNQGSGSDSGILAGIEWAIANGCQIVSMSLGARVSPGQQYSRVFEVAADRALKNGTLIIAAAGNESDRRSNIVNPVAHPANCPSIMAVAALDSQLQVASFSNREFDQNGGQVDIAGPGVDVYSSYPMATRYRRLSGTSMATPHVAGIAALHAEATGATGRVLWSLLTQKALRLPLPSLDVGAGLVQAP